MANEVEVQTKNGETKDLQLFDPLSKPKKLVVAVFVIGMVAVMVLAFAAFHWLYTEYFNFTATKAERMQELSDIKARCAETERESQKRILAAADEFSRKRAANDAAFKKHSKELNIELCYDAHGASCLI